MAMMMPTPSMNEAQRMMQSRMQAAAPTAAMPQPGAAAQEQMRAQMSQQMGQRPPVPQPTAPMAQRPVQQMAPRPMPTAPQASPMAKQPPMYEPGRLGQTRMRAAGQQPMSMQDAQRTVQERMNSARGAMTGIKKPMRAPQMRDATRKQPNMQKEDARRRALENKMRG